jgi:hypothetical protein
VGVGASVSCFPDCADDAVARLSTQEQTARQLVRPVPTIAGCTNPFAAARSEWCSGCAADFAPITKEMNHASQYQRDFSNPHRDD